MGSCRLCKRLIGSVSVTATAEALVINLPQLTFNNCEKYCLAVLQEIPTTVTRGLPVVFTIGTRTTEYPLVKCDGTPVTQEYVGQGYVYQLQVRTTPTSAIFKAVNSLCKINVNLPSIPVTTATATTGGNGG